VKTVPAKAPSMKILAGVQGHDEGQLLVDGKNCVFTNVQQAMELGIALIHQELNLAETLDVGANIFLGREPNRWGVIDTKRIIRESQHFLKQVGLDVHPNTPLSELTIGQQQLVEIAKALSINARLLIMDEPTSSLSVHETKALVALIHELRTRGVSVVYISHRLGEVEAVADRVEVLRDGENAGSLARTQITREEMVKRMVGREISQFYPHQNHTTAKVALSVRKLRTAAHPTHELSFSVRAGEIASLAGLVGAGRTELLETLFGLVPAIDGTMEVLGKEVRPETPKDAINVGLALVPEDRKHHGLVLEMGAQQNLSLASLDRDTKSWFLNTSKEEALYTEMVASMRIKTPNGAQPVQFLSGGNQQKVVIGKWLALKPKVLFLDEPTRGVDIRSQTGNLQTHGRPGLERSRNPFASSEMEELLGMSDRVLVMHEGRLSGELSRENASEEAIMALATGTDLAGVVSNLKTL